MGIVITNCTVDDKEGNLWRIVKATDMQAVEKCKQEMLELNTVSAKRYKNLNLVAEVVRLNADSSEMKAEECNTK